MLLVFPPHSLALGSPLCLPRPLSPTFSVTLAPSPTSLPPPSHFRRLVTFHPPVKEPEATGRAHLASLRPGALAFSPVTVHDLPLL